MKNADKKKLETKLHKVISEYVRKRDKHCVCCGSTYRLQAGHVISRRKKSTTFDERNVHCQCSACNFKHNYYPEIYIAWYVKKFGGESFVKLKEDSLKLKKWTETELLELIESYKLKLKNL